MGAEAAGPEAAGPAAGPEAATQDEDDDLDDDFDLDDPDEDYADELDLAELDLSATLAASLDEIGLDDIEGEIAAVEELAEKFAEEEEAADAAAVDAADDADNFFPAKAMATSLKTCIDKAGKEAGSKCVSTACPNRLGWPRHAHSGARVPQVPRPRQRWHIDLLRAALLGVDALPRGRRRRCGGGRWFHQTFWWAARTSWRERAEAAAGGADQSLALRSLAASAPSQPF